MNAKSIRTIIKNGTTTDKQLLNAANALGIKDLKVMWLQDYKHNMKGPIIINLGSSLRGGTHWVATYNNNYFDSMGQVPPNYEGLDKKNWTPLQIQKYNENGCGSYALLYLYYAIRNDIDGFYNNFNALNLT